MSVNGVTGSTGIPQMTSGSASGLIRALMMAIKQARKAHRDMENSHSDAAIEAAQNEAKHAAERAKAQRMNALMNFGISMTGAALQTGAQITGSQAQSAANDAEGYANEHPDTEIPENLARNAQQTAKTNAVMTNVASHMGNALEVIQVTEETFGSGRIIDEKDAQMKEDSAEQTLHNALEGRARDKRSDLDEELANLRQAYREINTGNQGGEQ